ncbi:MAG: hypothetical protein ACKO3A_07995 [Opitutia bacterium]
MLLPLFASAHNGEWLLAKLTIPATGEVTLTVTVDAEANFLIKDAADLAREAKDLLLVNDGKETRPWSEVAPAPSFATTDRLDPAAPLNHTPEELSRRYKLLQATWRWDDPPARFTLLAPEKSPHTVLLWLDDRRQPAAEARWVMLIGGDESPLIRLGAREARRELPWWLSPGIGDFVLPAIATAIGMLLVWFALGLNRLGEWLDRKRKP